ncbi:MAG TPA: OmpA family protein [Thermoanaerobaculia bacterium]|nr:OmpA family protein [Thermoanaerobaculia bacterium]
MSAQSRASQPTLRIVLRGIAVLLVLTLVSGCASLGVGDSQQNPRVTKRDKTAKGAGIGAAAGAAAALLKGKREADEILAGAAIGAAVGAGVGLYMDAQEERFGRIPGTTVERISEDTLLVHFDSDVLFDVDSAVLDGGAQGSLSEVASVLVEYPKTAVVIQGHTDSTGTEEHNFELSERRARSVYNYLGGRGVATDRMSALGHGEQFPVASNDSEFGRQQNRRVDVLLKAKAR